ncbi:MAG: ATP-grasp domain-containing protein [Nitrosarchaeum sp.]|nr:ATP-grasp domain-containing protein [Nitrosarchaeum sp.]
MKPKWIIEDFEPDNKFGELVDEVKRQGMTCEVVRYLPFQSGSYDIFDGEDCVLFQGSINLALQLQSQKTWIPGPWLTAKNYECSKYYAYLGKYLFNDKYSLVPRGDVLRQKNYLFQQFEQLFIRPSSGLKPFTAGLYSKLTLDSFWDLIKDFTDPESLIVISTPKIVKAEWRFICSKGDVLTGCQYEKHGKLAFHSGYPEEAKILAQNICKTYEPDPMFIVDICLGDDDVFYLMEINSFSCGGLYACELEPIVTRASELALKEWESYQ